MKKEMTMNAMACLRFSAMIVGACIALRNTPAVAQGIPWISIENVSLNPTSFYVSIIVSNTVSNAYYALEAYAGAPVGATGGFERVIVSDWVQGTGSSLILHDTSVPLPQSGRTYNAALLLGGNDYILGPNEVYAPYPFFTAPVISSIAPVPTNTGVLAITYGEGLYANTVYVSAADAAGFIRVKGTNHVPTNAVVERSPNPITWTLE